MYLIWPDHLTKYTLCPLNKQGHHLDLRLIRNQWLLLDPKIQVLMSESNEDKTSEDFREMGLRLAQEVISFLKKKMDRASRVGNLKDIRLSFVGHSIGNLIVRAALAGIYRLLKEWWIIPFRIWTRKLTCLLLFLFQKASWSHISDICIHMFLYLVRTWVTCIVPTLYSIQDCGSWRRSRAHNASTN